jgi:hypothetical protein
MNQARPGCGPLENSYCPKQLDSLLLPSTGPSSGLWDTASQYPEACTGTQGHSGSPAFVAEGLNPLWCGFSEMLMTNGVSLEQRLLNWLVKSIWSIIKKNFF